MPITELEANTAQKASLQLEYAMKEMSNAEQCLLSIGSTLLAYDVKVARDMLQTVTEAILHSGSR